STLYRHNNRFTNRESYNASGNWSPAVVDKEGVYLINYGLFNTWSHEQTGPSIFSVGSSHIALSADNSKLAGTSGGQVMIRPFWRAPGIPGPTRSIASFTPLGGQDDPRIRDHVVGYNVHQVSVSRPINWRKYCGNGQLDEGELFDNGQPAEITEYAFNCGATCGDGEVQSGEACDDGNRIDDDGCAANCLQGP
ncbi:MAG: hypothetical protein OSB21_07870, partial [Myxococcota bacterium]|nr:hypothetical protein [Myxococcota bacterium]